MKNKDTPDFKQKGYFTIDNIFPNLPNEQRDFAANFIALSVEEAYKMGFEAGLEKGFDNAHRRPEFPRVEIIEFHSDEPYAYEVGTAKAKKVEEE